jgi:hypothetical protein
VDEGAVIQGATGLIRKVAISLVMQRRDHFIHAMPTLREEFICTVSGWLINLNMKDLIRTQKLLAREDELRRGEESEEPREYGLRNFIPPSVIDNDEYWRSVGTKCFAISSELGPPTFFLTFTMNPHWHDDVALRRENKSFGDSPMIAMILKQRLSGLMKMLRTKELLGSILGFVWRIKYQKRGLPHAYILLWTDFDSGDLVSVDAAINVRYPLLSPFIGDDQKSADFVEMIKSYQVHRHSRRCETPEHRCRYGYPLPPRPNTVIQRRRFVFARDEDSKDVVPHNFHLLSQFRCYRCWEVIHSEQAIGHVMKYWTRNNDERTVAAGRVLYEGVAVHERQNPQYYAATRIASAAESFAALCGFWLHHMRPTVITLGFHLEDQKIVMAGPGEDSAARVNFPSHLERYFDRPQSEDCEHPKSAVYYSGYVLRPRPGGREDMPDRCQPVQFACERETPALCILRSVLPHQQEKFALRLMLRHFPARHWRDLLLQNGTQFQSFHDAAREAGLVGDINRKAHICMEEARIMNRVPSEMRLFLVLLVRDGADMGFLLDELYEAMSDEGDSIEDVHVKIGRLRASFADVYAHELAEGGD